MAEIILILIIILICLTVKYPSISLILFLTASFFKTVLMLRFGFFRVFDYTVLCGFLVLLAMFWSFLRSGGKISEVFTLPVFIFLLLVFILLLGAMYTTAPNYGWEKSTRFAVLGFIAFATN